MTDQQEILALLRQIADNNTKKNTQHDLEHEALRSLIEERKIDKEIKLEIKKKVIEGSVKALIIGLFVIFLGYNVTITDLIP